MCGGGRMKQKLVRQGEDDVADDEDDGGDGWVR